MIRHATECKTTAHVTLELDRLDREIVWLLSKRQEYVTRASTLKSHNRPENAADMLAQRLSWAADDKVDLALVKGIYDLLGRSQEIDQSTPKAPELETELVALPAGEEM